MGESVKHQSKQPNEHSAMNTTKWTRDAGN